MSNLTGLLAGAEIAQPDYWCDQILSPVQFAKGIDTLVSQGAQVFLEIGARPTLIGMARQCTQDQSLTHWPSLEQGKSDWQVLLRASVASGAVATALTGPDSIAPSLPFASPCPATLREAAPLVEPRGRVPSPRWLLAEPFGDHGSKQHASSPCFPAWSG